jgi:tRNA(fMet)-specific endonuclease VapC
MKLARKEFFTSIIAASEFRFGALKRNSVRLTRRVSDVLAIVEVRPFVSPAGEHYGRIRLSLERAGTPIGGNDMLIAAHALAERAVLVTVNTGEFSRVPGLKIENWLGAR